MEEGRKTETRTRRRSGRSRAEERLSSPVGTAGVCAQREPSTGGGASRGHAHGPTASTLRRLLMAPTNSLWIQLARYTLVGGVAFLADFGSLFALTDLGHLHYLLSAALAFLVGLSVNYLMSTTWVFHQHALANRWYELFLFALIGLVGLGLNEGCMWLLTGCVGCYYLVSKLGSTGLVYLWNFLARRYVLFS